MHGYLWFRDLTRPCLARFRRCPGAFHMMLRFDTGE